MKPHPLFAGTIRFLSLKTAVNMVAFEQATLENGLEIVAEINPDACSASMGFIVKAGSRFETAESAGVSHFLEHMVFKGAGNMTALDVNRRIDDIAANANASTSDEYTLFYASTIPEMLDASVELLGTILKPALREKDFETEKKVILEEIAMYEDQAPFGLDDRSQEIFFEGHPLAHSVLGTRQSIEALTVEQMREYFARYYRPDNIVVAAAGKIDFGQFVRSVQKNCGHWTIPLDDNPVQSHAYRRVQGQRGVFQFKHESASQQHVFLLADSPSSMDEDRYAAALTALLIGDESGSRLYWPLIDSGLADYASMGFCAFVDNGFYSTCFACEQPQRDRILDMIREVFEQIYRSGFEPEEFQRARTKVLSRIVLSSEYTSNRFFSVGHEWILYRKYHTLRQLLDRIHSITLDDIHAVLERYPLTDPLRVEIGP